MGVNGDLSKRDRLEVGLREAHVLTFHLILISTSYHCTGGEVGQKRSRLNTALYMRSMIAQQRGMNVFVRIVKCICLDHKMYLDAAFMRSMIAQQRSLKGA